jgi:hypothetical protein
MTAHVPIRGRFLGLGLLSLAAGILAFGLSVPMLMLTDTGWPWNASVRNPIGELSTVELVHDDGRQESFSGTREEVESWLVRREAALKAEYGLDTWITTGRVLNVTSLLLLTAGFGLLLWWLLVRLRIRSAGRAP